MIDEHVHPWDRPEPAHESTEPQVVTTPRQILSGLPMGLANLHALCSSCGQALHEGDRIWVYAKRAVEDPEWVLSRCYCGDCAVARIDTPTRGTSEMRAEARLNVVALSSEQRHQLCLGEVEVLAFSPLTEGDSA